MNLILPRTELSKYVYLYTYMTLYYLGFRIGTMPHFYINAGTFFQLCSIDRPLQLKNLIVSQSNDNCLQI